MIGIKNDNRHLNKIKSRRFFKSCVIPLLFSVAILVQPLAMVSEAGALSSRYSEFTIGESALSKYYFYSIESCLVSLSKLGERHFDYSDIKALNWFPREMSKNVIPVSFMEKTIADEIKDGKIWCDEPSFENTLLKNAFAFWKIDISDVKMNLICRDNGVKDGIFNRGTAESQTINCSEMDYISHFNNDGKAGKNPSGKLATQAFKDYIIKTVYGDDGSALSAPTMTLTNEESYWFNRRIVSDFCSDGATLTADPGADSASKKVSWVNDNSTESTLWLSMTESKWWKGSEIPIWNTNPDSTYGYPSPSGKIATTTCVSAIDTMNSSVQYYKDSTAPKVSEDPNLNGSAGLNDGKTTKCAIPGLGWILCPVLTLMSSLADDMLNLFEGFLVTSPSMVSNTSTTYKAWQIVRNIANIAFVIAFLVIIFSQITSVGVTNYGIKKMLPRLIIAAILVNLSFYICQIAVDLSNIIGVSLNGFLASPSLNPGGAVASGWWSGNNTWTSTLGKVGVIGIGIVAVSMGALAFLIPALLSAIVALAMILFILIGRQAIIILLVIISPLAFVAYLLPNTEKLFKKWQTTLTSMLLLFPIVAFVAGVSKLAANILTPIFNDNPDGRIRLIGTIAANAIVVLPLFIIPGLLKKALDGVGGIGAKLNGLSDKWGKSAGSKWTDSKLNKHMIGERANKKARIEGGVYEGGKYGKYNPNVWRSRLHKELVNKNTGKYGDKMAAMGVSQADKYNDENVTLASSRLNSMNLSQDHNSQIATTGEVYEKDKDGKFVTDGAGNKKRFYDFRGNVAMQQAAIKQMVTTNDVKGMNSMWDKTGAMDESQNSKYMRNTFANSLLASSNRPAYFAAGSIAAMKTHKGQLGTNDTIATALMVNTYSADKIAREDKDALAAVNYVINHKDANDIGKDIAEAKDYNFVPKDADDQKLWNNVPQKIYTNATKAATDPILSTLIAKNEKQINNIIASTLSAAPAPTSNQPK